MDTPLPNADPIEAETERQALTAEEDRFCNEAKAEADRVGTIPGEEVAAWARSLLTDHPLPRPKPHHHG